METVSTNVAVLLSNHKEVRDDIGKLGEMYAIKHLDLNHFNVAEFTRLALKIDRYSRKWQREVPELRGINWGLRQKQAKVVSEKMRNREKTIPIGVEEYEDRLVREIKEIVDSIPTIPRETPIWKKVLFYNIF